MCPINRRDLPHPTLSIRGWGGKETKFLVPDWGDTVDFVVWLSYRPASICSFCVVRNTIQIKMLHIDRRIEPTSVGVGVETMSLKPGY